MKNPEYLNKDFYAALGVAKDASQQDIKKAYRKLAQQLHPDANPGDKAAEERFKEVGFAYSVLSDPKKRAEYDDARRLFGSGAFGGSRPGAGGFPGGFPGGFGGNAGRVRTENVNLGDLGDLFGGLFGSGRASQRASSRRRGRDVESEITLGFTEAVRGATVPLQVRGPAACETCSGSGARPGTLPQPCSTCHGRGTVASDQGPFGLSSPCPTCGGRGTTIVDPCPSCQGTGVQVRTRQLRARIPVGVQDGATIRLKGQGEPGDTGGPPGDLIVHVHVTPHPRFSRRGNDLAVTVPMTYSEAVLGADLVVPTLDEPVTLRVAPGTQSGQTLRVRGRGVPMGKRAGDLLVTVSVTVPRNVPKRAKDLLTELNEVLGERPREETRTGGGDAA